MWLPNYYNVVAHGLGVLGETKKGDLWVKPILLAFKNRENSAMLM